jgi:hypothetical protein
MEEITIPVSSKRPEELENFARFVKNINKQIGFKVSSRGWCYQLEQFGLINKSQFDKVERAINLCRKEGFLPVDFVAEEEGRKFSCIHAPTSSPPQVKLRDYLIDVLEAEKYYRPDYWDGEKYYIQMLVEKIDLKTLFEPLCERYHIPISTSKGWSSILQRAEYTRRFKEAEERGLECVLLYCGDHDPDGLRISDTIRSNLKDLAKIYWECGETAFNPANLIIDRFGLNFDFIEKNKLSWIENLITGSGRNLADPKHKNNKLRYVQEYLAEIGERKCEANAIVVKPRQGKQMCEKAIQKYLGKDALNRFYERNDDKNKRFREIRKELGLSKPINDAIKLIDDEYGDVDDGYGNDAEDCPACGENWDKVSCDNCGYDGDSESCPDCGEDTYSKSYGSCWICGKEWEEEVDDDEEESEENEG